MTMSPQTQPMSDQSVAKDQVRERNSPDVQPGIRKWFIKNLLAVPIITGALLLTAGQADWIWGWVFAALLTANLIVMSAVLIPLHPDLIRERSGLSKGTKKWDLVLAPLMAHGTWITGVIAALDFRFGWSVPFRISLHLSGLALVATGFGVMLWAMDANRFFAPTVRIQTERGHHAVSGGPYRYLRHPGYFAILLVYLGMPLLFGSHYAWIPAGIGLIATFVRTALEDATLRKELPGYAEYARKTRSRLIPGIW